MAKKKKKKNRDKHYGEQETVIMMFICWHKERVRQKVAVMF